jgi:hypothetical protein
MFRQSIPDSARSRLIVLAIAATLLCATFASSAEANQNWTVSIKPSPGTSTLNYDIDPPQTLALLPCFTSLPPDKSVLYVCSGDKVNWYVKSSKGNDQMILLFEDADVIWNAKYNIIHTVHAKNGAQGGGTIATESAGETFEYAVFVVDQDTKQVFIDDPKIMTGGGTSPIETCYKLLRQLKQDRRAEEEVDDARQLCRGIKRLEFEAPPSK